MDAKTITTELNKRFAAPLPEFYRRRIIVWYDEDKEFVDQIDDLIIPDVKIIKLTGTNSFAVKKRISVDEPLQNFLIYKPFSEDNEEDDWLMDVKLYSEEFRADLTAIWMDEMGIPSSIAMRSQVKKYRQFFHAKSRRESVVKQAGRLDSPVKLQLAVLASISESDEPAPLPILRSVLSAGLDVEKNMIYQNMVKYETDDLFWSMAAQLTGYTDVDRSLNTLAAVILLSAGKRTLPERALDGLGRYLTENPQQQAYCADLTADWIHSGDLASYEEAAEEVEARMHLRDRFRGQDAEVLADTELFPCIDEVILTRLMTDIGNNILDTEAADRILEKRRTMVWFQNYRDYYDGIHALCRMQEFYKAHAAGFHLTAAKAIWDEYTKEYYGMDTWYRSFQLSYERSKRSYGGSLQDLFTGVCEKAENLYVNWYLENLGHNWTEKAAKELSAQGYINDIPRQEDFYDQHVRTAGTKMYVIISDAMRYEVAASLTEKLQRDMQGKVELSSMQGIFPTITEFGMAALLPHQKITIDAGGGHFRVLADGRPTDSMNRENILKKADPESITLKASELLRLKRAERSAKVKGRNVVYIYHDTIDEISHTSEEKVFSACQETLDEIENLVKIIVNDFGGTNIYITSDHGFLYTYSPLTEQAKTEKADFAERIVKAGRRFAVLQAGPAPDYLLPVKLPGGDPQYEGYAPRESIRIKTSAGSGMNFVHGGVSLQEMCVPLIHYRHLRNQSKEYQKNREKYDTRPVEIALLSSVHKITNMLFKLNFYQTEAVSGNLEPAVYNAYFIDSAGKVISENVKIIADRRSEDVQERTFRCAFTLKQQSYDSTEKYYLVIEQEGSTAMPQKIEFEINIAFATDAFDLL